jgi:hypothetical protein
MDRAVYDRMAEIDRDHWWFVGRRKIIRALIERFRPTRASSRSSRLAAAPDRTSKCSGVRYGRGDRARRSCPRLLRTAHRLAIKGGYLPERPARGRALRSDRAARRAGTYSRRSWRAGRAEVEAGARRPPAADRAGHAVHVERARCRASPPAALHREDAGGGGARLRVSARDASRRVQQPVAAADRRGAHAQQIARSRQVATTMRCRPSRSTRLLPPCSARSVMRRCAGCFPAGVSLGLVAEPAAAAPCRGCRCRPRSRSARGRGSCSSERAAYRSARHNRTRRAADC